MSQPMVRPILIEFVDSAENNPHLIQIIQGLVDEDLILPHEEVTPHIITYNILTCSICVDNDEEEFHTMDAIVQYLNENNVDYHDVSGFEQAAE